MKRVVVTGLGILSSIGNNQNEVLNALKVGQSGIDFSKKMQLSGMRSHICGKVKLKNNLKINRSILRIMNKASLYAYLAAMQAIEDAMISVNLYQKNPRVGIIVGSSINSPEVQIKALDSMRKRKRVQSIGPYAIIQSMSSSISACLCTVLKIYGVSYSISSACATSASCIVNAVELIQLGKQDIIFAGGSEESTWELACLFDAMGVLSTRYNDQPSTASRPYDLDRDGFVISEGSGILVLEELNHALLRKAPIYAEIIGCGSASDGYHIVRSSTSGMIRAMRYALKNIDTHLVDYLNVHATSTKYGDIQELNAIHKVFTYPYMPLISSTKSMTGHALGASGVQEVIYSLLMLKNNFVAPCINIDHLDVLAKHSNIVRQVMYKKLFFVMSNSMGFGGVNVSLLFKKLID
ncbi:MAG: beta-ketoacyl synthase N-terminal-like domain-containing protein [Buchnera aphidicola (Eriosoma harunire)]